MPSVKLLRIVVLVFLVILTGRLCAEPPPEIGRLEGQFRDLPIEARRMIGPLFWLHGDDSAQRLEMYVGKVAEGGNGTFTAESRPHTDWLGPGWYRDLGVCLAAAKRHGLKMRIFDEKWWPSQGLGGAVPPRYAAKRLKATAVEVDGPRRFDADGYAGPRYIAAVAGRVTAGGKIDGRSLVDLAPSINRGRLSWQAPAGTWKIMKFTHVQAPPLGQNGQLSVDGASKDCVDWFLRTVYQPHYDHFGADFGKTIIGFFYDEPETRGNWGTELDRTLAQRKVDWKTAYVAYAFELAGEEQIAARYAYLDAFAETWGRTMYGGMAQWCHAHGVTSLGHFMEHGNLYLNPDFCAGNMFQLQKYSDLGGIDAVFDQFVMGKRVADDAPTWQTPKLASSIAHAYGKKDDLAMVEIFGARGQDLTYPEMKWWADHMHVCGIHYLIPHSFNPRSPLDKDCPPYFYDGGYEPRWPLYRVFANYSSRLSLMLAGGRHVCPVALLFLRQQRQVGRRSRPSKSASRSRMLSTTATGCPTRSSSRTRRWRARTSGFARNATRSCRAAGRGHSLHDVGQGQAVLRRRRGGDRLRIPAVAVGHARAERGGHRRVARGDLGRRAVRRRRWPSASGVPPADGRTCCPRNRRPRTCNTCWPRTLESIPPWRC